MTKDEIVQKFLDAKVEPSKYSIQNILGFSAQTLVRRGFTMSEIQILYKEFTREVKTCPCCSVQFTNLNNTYCSSSCAAKTNNNRRSKKKLNCLQCGVILDNNKSRCCSAACHQKYHQEQYINAWLSGSEVGTTKGSSVSSRIRRYLFEKYGCKCARCRWGEINPVSGKSPLEVEHIDGNSKNNSPENLTLLCPNCHSLTPTYKALNKGKGRHKRMERYREGKSY